MAAVLVLGLGAWHRKIAWIGDAGVALLVGLIAGLFLRVIGLAPALGPRVAFKVCLQGISSSANVGGVTPARHSIAESSPFPIPTIP
jgi:hypothetical protein